jgi:hypothetical protein
VYVLLSIPILTMALRYASFSDIPIGVVGAFLLAGTDAIGLVSFNANAAAVLHFGSILWLHFARAIQAVTA